MGIIADFFVARPEEVEATHIQDFPIGSAIHLKGINILALEIFARLLTGSPFHELFMHIKPEYGALNYSEFGEPDQQGMIIFLRQNYKEDELEKMQHEWHEKLDQHILSMTGQELSEWVASIPILEQFHPVIVARLASCSPEQLRQLASQWRKELADSLQSSSLQEEDFFPFLEAISDLARQALAENKQLYSRFAV